MDQIKKTYRIDAWLPGRALIVFYLVHSPGVMNRGDFLRFQALREEISVEPFLLLWPVELEPSTGLDRTRPIPNSDTGQHDKYCNFKTHFLRDFAVFIRRLVSRQVPRAID